MTSFTRPAIAITGLAGLAVVGRAAVYYRSDDPGAFALTLIMGAALAAGLVELWLRAAETDRLTRGIRTMPESVDELSELEGELGARLSAQLEGEPLPSPRPVFAPYLVGLLVMLGLLGTFLGLFETLRGAREALTTSADVDALRAGLAGPMRGLMRSFGTSAAGVAASAMLGLGVVFQRRNGARLSVAIQRITATKLRHLSASRRQLDALQALAEQGEAIPGAAAALGQAAGALRDLETSFAGQIRALRDEVSTSIAQATLAQGEALDRVLREASAEQVKALAGVAQEQASAFTVASERAEERSREQLAALAKMAAEQSAAFVDATENARAAFAEASDSQARALIGAGARYSEALEETSGNLATSLEATAAEVRETVGRGLRDIAAEATAATAPVLGRAVEETRAAAIEQLEALREQADADAQSRQEQSAALVEQVRSQLEELLYAFQDAGRERGDRDEALLERIDAQSEALRQAEERQMATLAERWGEMGERVAASLEANAAREGERLERLAELGSRLDDELGRAAGLLGERLEADEVSSRQRGEELAALIARVDQLGGQLGAATELMRETVGLLQVGGAELGAAAEMFSVAVDAHGRAAGDWLEGLGRVERAVEEAGEGAAVDVLGDYLARTHELFDQQLGFQQELVEQLRETRSSAGFLQAPDTELGLRMQQEMANAASAPVSGDAQHG